MVSHPRAFLLLPALLALSVAHAAAASAESALPIENTIAEERAPYFAADPTARPLTATTAAAVVITSLVADGPAQRAGLRIGDRLLAIDGCRLHDLAELRLWTGTRPADTRKEHWTVARDGALTTLVIDDLDIAANVGASGAAPGDQPSFSQSLEQCGIAVSEADRALLDTVPSRVRHAVQEWIGEQAGPPHAPAWLAALATVQLAALRGQDAVPSAMAAPLPLVTRYDAFLRAVIAQRQGGDRDPDLLALGVDRFTAASWWPYPTQDASPSRTGTASGVPPYARIYRYCQERSRELAALCSRVGYGLLDGQGSIFRARCDLVAAALAPDAAQTDRMLQERAFLSYAFNDFAWSLATDERVADRESALAAGKELLRLGGRRLEAFRKDTVAACFARGGDIEHAIRWQEIAIAEEARDGGDASRLSAHMPAYRAGKPYTEYEARLAPTSVAYPDGNIKLEGFTDGGQRAGHWRAHRKDGSVSVDGWMLGGQPHGYWQTFDTGGRKNAAGWVWNGKRLGSWRTFFADGSTASSGSFVVIGQGTSHRTGLWTWFWTNGQPREAGCFLGGKRDGLWRAWSSDGRLLCETRFDQGNAVGGAWLGSAVPEELPAPLLEQPVTGADDF